MIAADILDELVRIRPDFRAYWEFENYFVGEDGSFTACGVFSHFTDYFREQHQQMTSAELAAIASIIGRCECDDFLATAAYTCFLENIAGDPPDATLAPFLSADAVEFMRYWAPE